MGVRITADEGKCSLFDSVTGWAFGPVFDTDDDADSFLEFTADGPDLRTLSDTALEKLHERWWKVRYPDD